MRLSNFFLFPLSFYLLLWGVSASFPASLSLPSFPAETTENRENVQAQLQAIDDQITELEEKKRGFLSRALRHDDQAERLQYRQEWFLEAKRHMELADENRQIADEIQQEIDRLKQRREQILQQNKNLSR